MDPELHAVRYAFDAALQRMCEATTDDALVAEAFDAMAALL